MDCFLHPKDVQVRCIMAQTTAYQSPQLPIFERYKKCNKQGKEFWSARQLAEILGYPDYRGFMAVMRKARQACSNSGYSIAEHFESGIDQVITEAGKKRKRTTIKLSRYACYLIVQNANPEKTKVALGQTYFAIQSRKQELTGIDLGEALSIEDQSRLLLRNQISRHNKRLAEAARRAGIEQPEEFSTFQNQGYIGLYGGLDREQLHKKKGLKKRQKVLDYMGSTELAANLFRATQTEEKLRRENIQGKLLAYKIHHQVGEKVRHTIEELGGTKPEELPTPIKGIKNIAQKRIKATVNHLSSDFTKKKSISIKGIDSKG